MLKKTGLVIAAVGVVLVGASILAAAETTSSWEENLACRQLGLDAVVVMASRQVTNSLTDTISQIPEYVENNNSLEPFKNVREDKDVRIDSLATLAVTAYRLPLYPTAKERAKVMKDFQNKVFSHCLSGTSDELK